MTTPLERIHDLAKGMDAHDARLGRDIFDARLRELETPSVIARTGPLYENPNYGIPTDDEGAGPFALIRKPSEMQAGLEKAVIRERERLDEDAPA